MAARAERGAAQARDAASALAGVDYALVAARGSSDNAARFFQYLAGQRLGLTVALAAPSLFEFGHAMGLAGAGVVAISQSGRTPGMVDVVAQARSQSRPTVVVTNDVASVLAGASDHVINLAVGEERAVASSKTFAATWHALAQLVEAIDARPLEGMDELPGVVGRIAAWALDEPLPLDALDVDGGLTVVGRGVGYAVAAEASLKIREVAGLRAEAFAAADYLHGPIGADGHGATLLLCVTEELT
ncbi:MAG: SIS domain-containing protein, partial [Acidimicrobiales bacterium]